MENKKEIKWAIAVGAVMITICLVAIMIVNGQKNNIKDLDIKLYKLNMTGENIQDYTYEECRASTEMLIGIDSEFQKAFKLEDKDKVTGQQILGQYKIVAGDNFIAFDNNEEGVATFYRSDTRSLYEMKSRIYDLVMKACE